MIERSSQAILNHQQSIDGFREQLEATNIAIDALRTEYRGLVTQKGE